MDHRCCRLRCCCPRFLLAVVHNTPVLSPPCTVLSTLTRVIPLFNPARSSVALCLLLGSRLCLTLRYALVCTREPLPLLRIRRSVSTGASPAVSQSVGGSFRNVTTHSMADLPTLVSTDACIAVISLDLYKMLRRALNHRCNVYLGASPVLLPDREPLQPPLPPLSLAVDCKLIADSGDRPRRESPKACSRASTDEQQDSQNQPALLLLLSTSIRRCKSNLPHQRRSS